MIRIALNLARRPAENLRRVRIVWGGALTALSALLVLLAIMALAGWRASRPIQAQRAALDAQVAPLAAAQARAQMRLASPAARATLEQAAYLNQLLDRKSVSWTQLFERLEQIAPPGVELVSLRPLVRDGAQAIDIRFASDTLEPAIDFVKQLEGATSFANVRVERETEARPPASGSNAKLPPRFQLEVSALYQGAAAGAGGAKP